MLKKGKIYKLLAVSLTVFLVLFYALSPILIYAQVATPTPTPDPSIITPTPTPDPSATPTATPTPTMTPDPSSTPSALDATPTPTPTPNPSTTATNASNSADLTNSVDSSALTGDNSLTATTSASTNINTNNQNGQLSSGTSNSGGTTNSSVQTGDAASVVNAQNSVNSTTVNSNVIDQIINIYVAQNGDLNLSDPFTVAANEIQAHPNDSVINVSFTNINNYVYLINNINSFADTGNNVADQSASITTGGAYSIVSLLNQVNFTVINSQVHIVTINVFGTLNGNIILPDPNASTNCSGCGINLSASSSADLTNNLNATANSGNNTATGSATITTGNASSAVNNVNLVNTNLVGTNAQILFINVLGNWVGNFIGWGNVNPQQGGASLTFFNLGSSDSTGATSSGSCSGCNGPINISNNAFVVNNINSSANSGGNSLLGNGSITTGDAFSIISLVNLLNTNFINSFGFFGFVNIFGNWTGDIGGLSNFLARDNNNNQGSNNNSSNTDSSTSDANAATVQEQGGQLSVTQTNNVGAFVYPGDTVTFSVKVSNMGTGKVYGTKLNLFLIYGNQIAGGTTFDLGDIPAQTGKGLTAGFVLSKNAPGGVYIARAVATGKVGPNDSTVSAGADSTFNILNNFAYSGGNSQKPHVTVLGAGTNKNALAQKSAQEFPYLLSLLLILLTYILLRGIRKRKYLKELFTSTDFKEKLSSLKMFLF
jgi:hypothetical protein